MLLSMAKAAKPLARFKTIVALTTTHSTAVFVVNVERFWKK
jgi:hypothetical protein